MNKSLLFQFSFITFKEINEPFHKKEKYNRSLIFEKIANCISRKSFKTAFVFKAKKFVILYLLKHLFFIKLNYLQ